MSLKFWGDDALNRHLASMLHPSSLPPSYHYTTVNNAPPVILPQRTTLDSEVFPKRPQNLRMDADNTSLLVTIDNAMSTDDVAIVRLHAEVDDQAWITSGCARRDPSDLSNPSAGLLLATSRALATLSRHFERQAEGQIKHDDDMRTRRQAKNPMVTVPVSTIAKLKASNPGRFVTPRPRKRLKRGTWKSGPA